MTTLAPLKERVLRDEQGTPRQCILCLVRLATVHVEYTLWGCDLCDECAEARQKRLAELEAIP